MPNTPRLAGTRNAGPLTLLASFVALTLLVAGCLSADPETAAAPPTGSPPPTTAATPPPAASPTSSATPAATITATASPPVEPTASTGALARSELPVAEFVSADGVAVSLPVEVVPRSEFSIGLSGRYALDERGMLFSYAEPRRTGFWMKNTHIDLAIAFIGEDGRINELREMTAESEVIIRPADDFVTAIEAPAGWYRQHGIAPGDRLRLAFELSDWLDASGHSPD